MLHKAKTSKTYKWRLGIVGILFIGFSAWCFYDWQVRYPARNVVREKYKELMVESLNPEEWRRYMVEDAKQWDVNNPQDPPNPGEPYTESSILAQFIMGLVTAGIGLPITIIWASSLGKWIGTDGHALLAGKRRVPFEDITELDSSRWKRKGIAVAHYKAAGKDARFVIDDWKYDRKPAGETYKLVKAYLAQRDGEKVDQTTDSQAPDANMPPNDDTVEQTAAADAN